MEKFRFYKNNKIQFVSTEEMARLFRVIRNEKPYRNSKHFRLIHKKNLAMFNLAYFLGLRASEVGLLTIDDYDPNLRQIYVTALKGSVSQVQRIDGIRARHIDVYLKDRGLRYLNPHDPLFPSTNNKHIGVTRMGLSLMMKKYAKKARWPKEKRHFHTLRHTIAIHLLESELDLKEVQHRLRHANINSTIKYFYFTDIQEKNSFRKITRSKYIA